jgi:hypothetical protein
VAEKESVSFSQQTMVATAGGLAVSFHVGARAVEGTITAEQFAKYERWKTS